MTREEKIAKLKQLKELRAARDRRDQGPGAGDYAKDVAAEALTATGVATEGMADLINLPINVGQRLSSAVKGAFDDDPNTTIWGGLSSTPPIGQATADFFKPVTEFAGQNRSVPEGESTTFDMARTGMKHGLPILMSGGLGGAAKQGPKTLVNAVNAMKNPTRAAAAGSALGAAGGEQLGGDTGETIGGIAGGVLGDWKGFVQMLKGVGNLGKGAKKRVMRLFGDDFTSLDNATDAEKIQALNTYLGEAFDPGALTEAQQQAHIQKLMDRVRTEVAAGKNGTIGQLTDDIGLTKFEQSADARSVQGEQMNINARINEDALAPLDQIAPTGVASRAAEAPQQRLRAATARVEDQAQVAEAQAAGLSKTQENFNRRLLNEAAPEGTTIDEIGTAGGKQLTKAVEDQYTQAWSAAGVPDQVTTQLMVQRLDDILPQLKPEDAHKVTRLQDMIEKLSDTGTPSAMREIDKGISALRRTKSNTRAMNATLTEMRDEFRNGLTPEGRELLRRADANYPNFLTIKDTANKAGYVKSGGLFKPSEAATASKKFGDPLTGKNPMQSTIVQGEQNMSRMTEAQRRAAQLRKEVPKRRKALEKTPAGKFAAAKPESVVDAAKNAMKGDDPVKNLKQILRGTEGTSAREDIRRGFVESIRSELVDEAGKVNRNANEVFTKQRPILEKSGMFTPDELDKIADGMVESQKLYLGKNAERLAKIPPQRRKLIEAVAALAGAKIGAQAMGSPLIGANLGRKAAREKVEAMTSKKAQKLAHELAVNPQKFVDIVDNLNINPTQKEIDTFLARLAARSLQTGASESKVED